jgi:hypothetical protein
VSDQPANPTGLAPNQDDLDNKWGFYTFDRIKKIADQAQPYVIERLIIPGSIGVLVGEWGIGKSPFAIQLAITLAAAIDKFLEHYKTTGHPHRVLYIDMENGAAAILDVAQKICQFLNLAEVPKTFKVYSPNYSDRPIEYSAYALRSYILVAVKQSHFDFIIIDPLRAYCPEAESKNEDAIKFIQDLRSLAKASGATILMIHHPRKPKSEEDYSLETDPHNWLTQACGSAAIIQNVDYRMGLQVSKEGVIYRSYLRVEGWGPVHHLVRAYDDNDEPLGYRLERGIDKLDKTMRLRFEALPKNFTTKEAKDILKLSSKPANDKLNEFVLLGLIKKVDRGKWEKLVEAPVAAQSDEELVVRMEDAAPGLKKPRNYMN